MAMCLYCMAILIWELFLLEDLGDHPSSLSFPSIIPWPQISASRESEQALSSLGRFLINWCFGLCWHGEEILCSLERSRLRTTEALWSAEVKLPNMIRGQHLSTFRAPDTLVLPGSLETRAHKDWPVLAQALCFGFVLFGTTRPNGKPRVPLSCRRGGSSTLFCQFWSHPLYLNISLMRDF